eukprot:21555_1
MAELSKKIDEALGLYYEFRNQEGYFDENGMGKFQEWTEDNGYDTAMIEEELGGDAADCTLLEYDEDFPTHLEGDLRAEFMFDIMKRCKDAPLKPTKWERMIGGFFIFKYKAKLVHVSPNEFVLVGAEDTIDDHYAVTAKRHYLQQIYGCMIIKKNNGERGFWVYNLYDIISVIITY